MGSANKRVSIGDEIPRKERRKQVQNKELIKKRRRQIVDGALKLFLKQGIKATTIREICAESGVNKSSIYDYVKNKEEIVGIIVNEMHTRNPNITDPNKLSQSSGNDPMREYVKSMISGAWSRNHDAILFSYRETHGFSKENRNNILSKDASLVDRIANAIRTLGKMEKEDPRIPIIAEMVVYFNAFSSLRGWHLKDHDPKLLLDTVTDTIVNMIQAEN